MPAVTTGSMHLPCPGTVVEASASHVVGSLPLLDEFAAPVHQEQHTAEQVVHAPIPQIQEKCVECVNVNRGARFPERAEEHMVDVPVPPTVEDTVEVMQIIPDSPVPQTAEESSEVMRLQEWLLSSVAALSRVQATASSLNQRVIEHERRIQEQNVEDAKVIPQERLPEQVIDHTLGAPASPPASPSARKRKKGQTQKVNCGQCTRWHRRKSGAGYKYWTHEVQRLLVRDQIVKYNFNMSEIRSGSLTSTSPNGYKVLSMTGTDSRMLRKNEEGQPEFQALP